MKEQKPNTVKGFNNGGQIPAYGNEKTSAQVIAELEEENAALRSENEKLRVALAEVIPIAERMQSACESGETFDYSNEHDFRDSQEYLKAISNAKSLLQSPVPPEEPNTNDDNPWKFA